MIPEILYLQADGDYVQIHTINGKYLKEQTMKYFELHLPAGQFVRVHRSTIVNVEMISRIELYEKQSQQLTLKNGQQVKTSPSGYKALRAALNL
jgi:DNA-binding LytR/AlgR family response regulator